VDPLSPGPASPPGGALDPHITSGTRSPPTCQCAYCMPKCEKTIPNVQKQSQNDTASFLHVSWDTHKRCMLQKQKMLLAGVHIRKNIGSPARNARIKPGSLVAQFRTQLQNVYSTLPGDHEYLPPCTWAGCEKMPIAVGSQKGGGKLPPSPSLLCSTQLLHVPK
jgi:hypothetical protein